MTRSSQRLNDLKKSSSDEWYTRREDVALALDHLELNGHPVNGLRVLCPCDTPASAFVRELTARGAHVAAEWGAFQTLDMTGYDLIATNPPFSIFTAFYKAVRQSGSPFLILAPLAACAYKDVFNDIRDRRVTAFSTHPTSYRFTRPGGTTGNAPCCWLTSQRVAVLHGQPAARRHREVSRRDARRLVACRRGAAPPFAGSLRDRRVASCAGELLVRRSQRLDTRPSH